jgi:hypothetical protein
MVSQPAQDVDDRYSSIIASSPCWGISKCSIRVLEGLSMLLILIMISRYTVLFEENWKSTGSQFILGRQEQSYLKKKH